MSQDFLAAERVRADLTWWRALEHAASNREAAVGRGARYLPTSHVGLEPPPEAREGATQVGGESQPEERHNMATEAPWIDRRR
jgi:hypothetical protein